MLVYTTSDYYGRGRGKGVILQPVLFLKIFE